MRIEGGVIRTPPSSNTIRMDTCLSKSSTGYLNFSDVFMFKISLCDRKNISGIPPVRPVRRHIKRSEETPGNQWIRVIATPDLLLLAECSGNKHESREMGAQERVRLCYLKCFETLTGVRK